jgi:hypothetical protein
VAKDTLLSVGIDSHARQFARSWVFHSGGNWPGSCAGAIPASMKIKQYISHL